MMVWENQIARKYFDSINKFEEISAEEEARLITLAQNGDLEARDALITNHLSYVGKIAFQYARAYGLEAMDLVQEGNQGLLRALDKYKIGENVRFITYATFWVRAFIVRYIDYNRWAVKGSPNRRLFLRQFVRLTREFNTLHGRDPEMHEVCDAFGMEPEKIEQGLSSRYSVSNFESRTGQESAGSDLFIEDLADSAPGPERITEIEESRSVARGLIETIRQEYAEVYHMLHPQSRKDTTRDIDIYLRRMEGESLQSIGSSYNVTRERIRQIEKRAKRVVKYILHLHRIEADQFAIS